ncbi:N/A [soil metagenome]
MVVAVRDSVQALPRCLDSIIGQNDAEVDLVVIDGASTDGTVELLEARSGEIGSWVSEPDRGVYDAWNKALDHARGDWLCFLGSDDRFAEKDVLARMAPHLAAKPARVVYGITQVMDEAGMPKGSMGIPWEEARPALDRRMSLPNPSTFFHRDLFRDHGRFDARFRIAGDYEFLLRELATQAAFFVPDVVVTIMGAGGLSQAPRNRPLSLREGARARRLNGLPATPDWRSYEIYEAYWYAWMNRWFGEVGAERVWSRYQSVRRRLAGA